ncbi:hypothetical protein F5Y18DRAFT_306956 [Xylariaceae sp. FL1019]|nr:hypothetical protein F5Y18DRAFT_306956 [Xylariaceae sp. FL1019]
MVNSSATKPESYDATQFWRSPARNFKSSARLGLQHLLFQNTVGYLLHPEIEDAVSSTKPLAIADLGCGNAAWLIDLERHLSKKNIQAKYYGYDVNAANLPHREFLPESISLEKLDILSELPEQLKHAFDIVHVRAFISIVVNGNTTPLLSAVLYMLKPGGWIQWDETPGGSFQVQAPTGVSATMCNTLVHIVKQGAKANGNDDRFVSQLDQELSKHGLVDSKQEIFMKHAADFKAWTDDYLMVWEELWIYFPTKTDAPDAPMTQEGWLELVAKVAGETEQGVVIHQEKLVVAIGRKVAE